MLSLTSSSSIFFFAFLFYQSLLKFLLIKKKIFIEIFKGGSENKSLFFSPFLPNFLLGWDWIIIVWYSSCLFPSNIDFLFLITYLIFLGLVETDPEGALAGFGEVVRMEAEKAEWWACYVKNLNFLCLFARK
jgi:hypothetical protein